MKAEYVSVNKDESSAIKGLLIFLIILGHNSVFTDTIKGSFHYLYSFHVQAFFILPFFYKRKEQGLADSIKKNFIRLYYPYMFFFILLSFICHIIDGNNIEFNNKMNFEDSNVDTVWYFLNTIFTGNFYLIDYFSGFQYLWFLPVLFSMNLIMNIENNKTLKYTILFIGFISYLLFFVFMYKKPFDGDLVYYLMLVSPFAILQGCGAYFLGKLNLCILNNNKYNTIIITSTILFITLTLLYLLSSLRYGAITLNEHWFYRFIMPILFFNYLILIKKRISKNTILKKLGEYSLPIYILHPPICTISYFICQKYLKINLVNSIIIQVVILILSYYIAVLWLKFTPLRKITLPSTVSDLKL